MLILACDTAGPAVGAALWQDGKIIALTQRDIGRIHAATFMPMVANLLRDAGFKASQIDCFAVTTGPGSFTGIRIGMSAVKAMAYAARAPVVGYSSLEVLAWPWRRLPCLIVCPVLDARNSRIYSAAWLEDTCLVEPANRPADEFCRQLDTLADRVGRGCQVLLVGDPLPSGCPDIALPLVSAPGHSGALRVAALAEMASQAFRAGATQTAAALTAEYLAVPAAERLRQKPHG